MKVTEKDIINKYFEKPTIFGNRYFKYDSDWRVNKIDQLKTKVNRVVKI